MRVMRIVIYAAAAVATGLLLVVAAILWSGRGQVYAPEMLRQQLAAGMSIKEVEWALGAAPGSLQMNADTQTAELARPGLWAELGIPQNRILLHFDADGKLETVSVTVQCTTDEETYGIPLRQGAIH